MPLVLSGVLRPLVELCVEPVHFTSEDRDEVKIQKKRKWRISTHILVNTQNIIDIKEILEATRLKLLITHKETSN